MSARREEAYLTGYNNVLYRTCGHNKLCPYRGCLKCLQVNMSYTELTYIATLTALPPTFTIYAPRAGTAIVAPPSAVAAATFAPDMS